MDQALFYTNKMVENAGHTMSEGVFITLVNYLSLGLIYPQLYQGQDKKPLLQLVNNSFKTYEEMAKDQPLLQTQQLKLRVLWHLYRSKAVSPKEQLYLSSKTIMKGLLPHFDPDLIMSLKEKAPKELGELESLVGYWRMKELLKAAN